MKMERAEAENPQERMERLARSRVEGIRELEKGRINEWMELSFEGCSFEESTLILRFPVREWQLNRSGIMHGGMISTAFDITMGFLAYLLTDGKRFCPTINFSASFLRPAQSGKDLIVKAQANFKGRTLIALNAAGWQEDREKPVATASAQFMVGPEGGN